MGLQKLEEELNILQAKYQKHNTQLKAMIQTFKENPGPEDQKKQLEE